MPTQIKDGKLVADPTAEQAHDAADTTIQRVRDFMIQLVRHGQDISLSSLQVWADVARQFGPPALRSPARAEMVSLASCAFVPKDAALKIVGDD